MTADYAFPHAQTILATSSSLEKHPQVVSDPPGGSDPDWIHLRSFDLGMTVQDHRRLRRQAEQV